MWTVIIFSNKDRSFFDFHWGGGGVIAHLPSYWVVVPNNFSLITIRLADVFAMNINSKRLLHDISISTLVSARDFHIKPQSEAGWLIWVKGWYQGRYGKCHVIIYLSHIIHWPFSSIYFYIAVKIFELTNRENKSLRELPLFNLQIFLFRVLYNDSRKCLQTLPKTLTFQWKFLFKTTYTFDLVIPFQVI